MTQARSSTATPRTITTATQGSTLADILERVLDKGIVIAGDISVSVGSTELLSIRIRLLVASVDKAREMGINWWEGDPFLSHQNQTLLAENQQLQQRLAALESQLKALQQASETPLAANPAAVATMTESAQAAPPRSPPSEASSPDMG
ncbi:gas vesicle protein [Trichothermofontia sichuanensis B231]|nr:gas vesicle protein GvpJ [Trichothermofontia sichuanensis]UZQ56250.1 gas vesicle protein [Trichothermofontia sichuanensis B231]